MLRIAAQARKSGRSARAARARRPRPPLAGCRGRSGGACAFNAGDDREHRDAGGRIIGPHEQRQRPEMRRRPQEDDREQQQRQRRDLAGRRDPADQRRKRSCRAADDDVLRRCAASATRCRSGRRRGSRRQAARPPANWSQGPSAAPKKRQGRPRSEAPTGAPSGPPAAGAWRCAASCASISASYHWLSAPQAPAPSAMQRIAVKPSTSGGSTGATSKPHRPVKTTRLITRGLVSATKSRQSAGSAAGLLISRVGMAGAIRGWRLEEKPLPAAGPELNRRNRPR